MKCPRCAAWTTVLATRQEGDYILKRTRRCANECKPFVTREILANVHGQMRRRLGDAHRTAERRALLYKRNKWIADALAKGTLTGRQIAAEVGVSESLVSLIKRGKL